MNPFLRPQHRLSNMAEPARITRSAKRAAAELAAPSRDESIDSPTFPTKRVKFESTPPPPADASTIIRQVIADVGLEQMKAEEAEEIKAEVMQELDEETLAHPPLTFDYAHSRAHLIGLDERWRHWMDRLKCKPFEEPEPFNPFRSLVVSIIGGYRRLSSPPAWRSSRPTLGQISGLRGSRRGSDERGVRILVLKWYAP